ncbi:MAG: ABC transporter ATP-binding protein [Gemmatales bacterium]|nr:ABC transporter ATP-binding protein [Gemmatales bacterium]MDW8174958.1 ABC transporter ATP-binding protein [Gemmatales bacterium]
MPGLQVRQLTKAYIMPSGPLEVLRGIDLDVQPGEAIAIMGPSGSGKSTFLYILGTLEPPSSGTVLVDGEDPFQRPAQDLAQFRNRHIGFVFQEHYLLPQCTVWENVLVPSLINDISRLDAAVRARQLLEQVGLSHRLHHYPAELSGGERQRVAMARALINKPRLVLADEPTGNLDRQAANTVVSLLLDLVRNHGVILVLATHSLEIARRFARIYELFDGQLHLRDQ